jgi:hypothetical protein
MDRFLPGVLGRIAHSHPLVGRCGEGTSDGKGQRKVPGGGSKEGDKGERESMGGEGVEVEEDLMCGCHMLVK